MMNTFNLRDYQRDMVARIKDAWREHRSVMVQMPTGTGKTHVLAAVVRDSLSPAPSPRERGVDSISKYDDSCDGNYDDNKEADKKHITPLSLGEGTGVRPYGTVWLVAHRRELVAQIEETIQKMPASANAHSSFFITRFGSSTRLHSSFPRSSSFIKVLSIQWLSRHLEEMEGEPSLVVIDEAHHAVAETYRTLWDRFPKARFLGLTATPCRMNRRGFTDLFDVLLTSWSVAEFIRKGQLSVFDYVSIRANSEEQRLIDSLEKRGADGDYQTKEMNAVLNRDASIGRLYQSMERYAHGKKGIVYAISIEHARRIAEYYNGKGVKTAVINSRTPAEERRRIVEEFRRLSGSRLSVLVNVDIFSEGFDCPDVEFVQMARPTLSLAKYLQQVGRGLRKSEGKASCVLIDNVGLCRVFGLPTSERDWQAMFRGTLAGKGTTVAQAAREGATYAVDAESDDTKDCGMEVVVSHDTLLEELEREKDIPPVSPRRPCPLKTWRDERSGLLGLRSGRTRTTDALFVNVFDIEYEMAAVRFKDLSCGIVDGQGNVTWKGGALRSMKFMRSRLLHAIRNDNGELYLDLCNMRTYARRPEVRKYGSVELLKVDSTYYSRTRKVYVNGQGLDRFLINWRGFYLTVYDDKVPVTICDGREGSFRSGFACLLEGDDEGYYWLDRRLADGSIVVRDDEDRFYHATGGKPKEYVGRCGTPEEKERCMAEVECIAERAEAACRATETEKSACRTRLLGESGEVVPFRSGTKWGLKAGGRVIVAPVYRNVRPPVCGYCAVEEGYARWGVMALDGTLVVRPQYSDIKISVTGTATGTTVTGSKVRVKLPPHIGESP